MTCSQVSTSDIQARDQHLKLSYFTEYNVSTNISSCTRIPVMAFSETNKNFWCSTFIVIDGSDCSDHGQGTQYIRCFNKLQKVYEVPIKSPTNNSEPRSCSLAIKGTDPYIICHLQLHEGNELVQEEKAKKAYKYKFNIWIHSPTKEYSKTIDHYSISKTFNMYTSAGKSIIKNECLLTSVYGHQFTMLLSVNLTSGNVIQKLNISQTNQESSIKFHQGALKIFLRSAINTSPALEYANITLLPNCSFSVTEVSRTQYNTTYFCTGSNYNKLDWLSTTSPKVCKANTTYFGAAQYPSDNYFITSDPKKTYGRKGPGINILGNFVPLASNAAGIAYSSCTDIEGNIGAVCLYESDTCFSPGWCIISFLIGQFPEKTSEQNTATNQTNQTKEVQTTQTGGFGLVVTITLLVFQSCSILSYFAFFYRRQLKRQIVFLYHKIKH